VLSFSELLDLASRKRHGHGIFRVVPARSLWKSSLTPGQRLFSLSKLVCQLHSGIAGFFGALLRFVVRKRWLALLLLQFFRALLRLRRVWRAPTGSCSVFRVAPTGGAGAVSGR
jgi:hypothetical protein